MGNRARIIRNMFELGIVADGGKLVIYHSKSDTLIPWIQRQMAKSVDLPLHNQAADPSYFSEELFRDLRSVTSGTNITIESQENNLEARLYFGQTETSNDLYSSFSKCLLQMFCERKLSPDEVIQARTLL